MRRSNTRLPFPLPQLPPARSAVRVWACGHLYTARYASKVLPTPELHRRDDHASVRQTPFLLRLGTNLQMCTLLPALHSQAMAAVACGSLSLSGADQQRASTSARSAFAAGSSGPLRVAHSQQGLQQRQQQQRRRQQRAAVAQSGASTAAPPSTPVVPAGPGGRGPTYDPSAPLSPSKVLFTDIELPLYDPAEQTVFDVVVVGSGPSGLAVADRVAAAGFQVGACLGGTDMGKSKADGSGRGVCVWQGLP